VKRLATRTRVIYTVLFVVGRGRREVGALIIASFEIASFAGDLLPLNIELN
jgi:hypothetical protein